MRKAMMIILILMIITAVMLWLFVVTIPICKELSRQGIYDNTFVCLMDR